MPTLAQRDTSGTFGVRAGELCELPDRRTRSAKVFRLLVTYVGSPEEYVLGGETEEETGGADGDDGMDAERAVGRSELDGRA